MLADRTPYPEVNAFLAQLLTSARHILGEKLVGMYLYGSLASGDFDPASSDVDFVVVTSAPLGEGEVAGAVELEVALDQGFVLLDGHHRSILLVLQSTVEIDQIRASC